MSLMKGNTSIECGWIKWKEVFGISSDKRITMRPNGNFYKSVVRPTMLYGSV